MNMQAAIVEHTSTRVFGSQSMIGRLRSAIVHLPGPEYTEEAWQGYGLAGHADRGHAVAEQEGFLAILRDFGVELHYLAEHASIQCTATYDPALITDGGAIMMTSGRPERKGEVFPMARALVALDIPIIGWIGGEGTMDAGDTLWLDHETLLVGRSYRTNDEGFAQLRSVLDGHVANVQQFELPHWLGPQFVLHLMSVVSLVDHELAVVYPRAVPLRLMSLLREREYRLIEVPDAEWDTQGCNVLALAPGVAVMAQRNPITAGRLRDAGVEVFEYPGDQITRLRVSGPTCNSRPVLRDYGDERS
jgi:N-dimethylarginine dimethylaminohydrolase